MKEKTKTSNRGTKKKTLTKRQTPKSVSKIRKMQKAYTNMNT